MPNALTFGALPSRWNCTTASRNPKACIGSFNSTLREILMWCEIDALLVLVGELVEPIPFDRNRGPRSRSILHRSINNPFNQHSPRIDLPVRTEQFPQSANSTIYPLLKPSACTQSENRNVVRTSEISCSFIHNELD